MNDDKLLKYAQETIEIEISEAKNMLKHIDKNIVLACKILLSCKGKVVISGIGKSGHIGKKISASLSSTGTPSFFVHSTEALHGDLGMISACDVVIFISYSGQTQELKFILPFLTKSSIPIISLTGDTNSPLALASDCVLNIQVTKEACPIGLIPTSSAVNTLMMGDALTIALMRIKEFDLNQFAKFHPGGNIGTNLLNRISYIMKSGKKIPKVSLYGTVTDAIFELIRTHFGLVIIYDDFSKVVGIFSNEDLEIWITKGYALTDSISKAMKSPCYTLQQDLDINSAIKILKEKNLMIVPVVDINNVLVGIISIEDLI